MVVAVGQASSLNGRKSVSIVVLHDACACSVLVITKGHRVPPSCGIS